MFSPTRPAPHTKSIWRCSSSFCALILYVVLVCRVVIVYKSMNFPICTWPFTQYVCMYYTQLLKIGFNAGHILSCILGQLDLLKTQLKMPLEIINFYRDLWPRGSHHVLAPWTKWLELNPRRIGTTGLKLNRLLSWRQRICQRKRLC